MHYIFNDPLLKPRRKQLRNNLGLPEIILWNHLKGSKLGVKFRRQYGVGKYILDFYCHEKKFGIELDGESHNNDKSFTNDMERTRFINNQGISVIRYTNIEVLSNIEGVIEDIKKRL